MKKVLVIALVAMMAVIGFAGCTGTASTASVASVASSVVSEVVSEVASVEESSEATSVEVSSEAASVEASSVASVEETSSEAPVEKTSVDLIKEKGVITMYTCADFPPFEFISGGKTTGVDIEIGKAIAAKLGVELKIENIDFNSVCTAVAAGKADFGASGLSITEERLQAVDFSKEYIETRQAVIYLDNVQGYAKFSDLKGAKIGVQLNTTGNFCVEDEINDGSLKGTGATCVAYNSPLDAATDLLNDKIHCVVVDELTAKNIVANNKGLAYSTLTYDDGTTTIEKYAIAIAKGDTALAAVVNEVLDELLAGDKITAWYTQYATVAMD